MKKFKGKALYQPSGKAAEYSPWAVNFYTGCSNDCEYCYCKRGVMSKTWENKPHLKKCFDSELHAAVVFVGELKRNLEEARKSSILFSFTTDPMLPETKELTYICLIEAIRLGVPVKILTKRADWLLSDKTKILKDRYIQDNMENIAFGFTLTGCDEQEPGASNNSQRIAAMKELHDKGFKTWASIEPVIEISKSIEMIESTLDFCDLYKVGLLSGCKKDYYNPIELDNFYTILSELSVEHKIYLKDSFLKELNMNRENQYRYFVNSDFNLFNSL